MTTTKKDAIIYTKYTVTLQLCISPIDIQHTDKGMWFTVGREAVVNSADYPEEQLRVEMFG